MAKKKFKPKLDIATVLSFNFHCGIYLRVNGQDRMFYSVTQALMYFKMVDVDDRKRLYDRVNIPDLVEIYESAETKELSRPRCLKLFEEILLSKFCQNKILGELFVKTSSSELGSLDYSKMGFDSHELIPVVQKVRRKLRSWRRKNNKRIPYYQGEYKEK